MKTLSKTISHYFLTPFVFVDLAVRALLAYLKALNYVKNPIAASSSERHKTIHHLINRFLFLNNIDFQVIDGYALPAKPILFVANHKSNVDPLVIYEAVYRNQRALNTTFIAKIELLKQKVSYLMDLIDCVFIDRQNPRQIMQVFKTQAVEILKNHHSITVFAEGTRITEDFIAEFKPGVFQLAFQSSCLIVPVSIYNSVGLLTKEKTLKRQQGKNKTVYLHFAKPIRYHDYVHYNSLMLAQKVHTIVVDNYEKLKKVSAIEVTKTQKAAAALAVNFEDLKMLKNIVK